MTHSRIRAAAAGITAAALALSGCSLFGGESTREFCVVADDIAAVWDGDAFEKFAELVGSGGDGEAFAANVRAASAAAVLELAEIAELMDEASRATQDDATAEAFTALGDGYAAIGELVDEGFSDVQDADDVSAAFERFVPGFQAVSEDDGLGDAAYAVENVVAGECEIRGGSETADGGVREAAAAAKSDASKLGKEIATYFVDALGPPAGDMVTIEGDNWLVAGEIVGYVSDNVVLTDQHAVDNTDWCVQVTETEAQVTFSYSARQGLTDTPCSEQRS